MFTMIVNVDRQQQLAENLVEQAKVEGLSLVEPGGQLSGLTKIVIETALETEMGDEYLGYPLLITLG